ncbi:MAG: DUF3105 domain-containing protein [Roseiflexaceae bacterium]|nr:DUF3105 domain-containing protein [Roseiflexaceae bacterium]
MSQSNARRSGRQGRVTKKKNNTPLIIGGVAVGLIIAAAAIFSFTNSNGPAVGTQIDDSGPSLHLQTPNDPLPVPYNSNPPTSGYHWGGGVAPWGVQTKPISDTITVHNIEHGGVIIHYREGLDQPMIDKLSDLTRDLQRQNPCIILVPRPSATLDVPIALTAWNYLLKLDAFDEASVRGFFKAHVGRGPEAVCQPIS